LKAGAQERLADGHDVPLDVPVEAEGLLGSLEVLSMNAITVSADRCAGTTTSKQDPILRWSILISLSYGLATPNTKGEASAWRS